MFQNRKDELDLLEGMYRKKSPKLVVLYGRRRVGKTELLMEFSRRHKALYLVARQESQKDQLSKLSSEIADFFKDNILKKNPFNNYDALFTYLAEKTNTPIFFDEFPYLIESNKALPSILQEYWDRYFSKKPSFIVLCGSSIRMMETLLGYKSPLYGRRTEQILLEPLKFKDACCFIPKLDPEQKVMLYSILGGTPAYLLEFDYNKSIKENIKENILKKSKFLYQDVLFVIREELNEPRNYFSIIKSIAKGNTKIGSIINDTGLDKGTVIKYLSVLIDLQLIERRVPITEKSPEKSRKGIYLLKDNYFKFWFRFIFGNNNYIEQGMQDKLISDIIWPELNQFLGQAYEEIVLEWIKEQRIFNNFLFGRWWDKDEEIDIVGIDKKANKIVFGEVKWKALAKKEAMRIINILKEKSNKVRVEDNIEKKFILIAKKIEAKKELNNGSIVAFDLEDICKN